MISLQTSAANAKVNVTLHSSSELKFEWSNKIPYRDVDLFFSSRFYETQRPPHFRNHTIEAFALLSTAIPMSISTAANPP
ncbi:CLUMA_CG019865, isoform A [Clunio marinus]|uniref:CLUMA_CG019865, isoform A n=1 Tax=Clunio marinus TaxID=568069 RepID=A0A1J1J2F3_9DIPT|nr:CLUMA_CG019865, isoform A [Clunio marinus]